MPVLLSSRLWTRSGCGSSHAVVLASTRFRAERRKPVNILRFFSSSRSALLASSSSTEKQRLATLRLYRILQRASRSFPTQNTATDPPLVLLQPPLKANDWGRHMIFKPPSSTMVEELFRLFYVMNDSGNDSSEMVDASSIDDWYYNVVGRNDTEAELPPMTSMTCWTTTDQIQEAIRTAFRASVDAKHDKLSGLHFWAIRAVQFMHEQQILWKNSSVATTKGVRVTATSRYGMDCECTSWKLFVTSHWKVRYSHSPFFLSRQMHRFHFSHSCFFGAADSDVPLRKEISFRISHSGRECLKSKCAVIGTLLVYRGTDSWWKGGRYERKSRS